MVHCMSIELDQSVTGTEIASRLGVSRERVRQLEERPDYPLPVGVVGRSKLWRWAEVEGWARDTGRLPLRSGVEQRIRALPTTPMSLTVDDVITFPGFWAPSICHLRIFEGEGRVPVVILGNLDGLTGTGVTNAAEIVAGHVAAAYLPDATDIDWYEVSPQDEVDLRGPLGGEAGLITIDEIVFRVVPGDSTRGFLRRRGTGAPRGFVEPQWRRTSLTELERRVGRTLYVFPPGTYTAANVRAYCEGGYCPIRVAWDPYHLAARSQRLHTVATELSTFARWSGQIAPVTPQNADKQHWQGALETAAVTLATSFRAMFDGATRDIAQEPPDLPILKALPPIDEGTWGLVDRYVQLGEEWPVEDDAAHLLQLRGQLEHASAAFLRGTSSEDDAGSRPDPLIDALTAAERELSFLVGGTDPHFRAYDHPKTVTSSAITVRGPADREYLDSVSWRRAPAPGDGARWEALRQGYVEPSLAYRVGYDLFGRMVLYHEAAREYIVEYPLALPHDPFPDDAILVASNDGGRGGVRAIYVQLPDGRVDLLPADPGRNDDGPPPFTWGYSGSGPANLASAIYRAVIEDTRDPAVQARLFGSGRPPGRYTATRQWLDRQLASMPREAFHMQVGEIRRMYAGGHDDDALK
jgi:hypothetical protein